MQRKDKTQKQHVDVKKIKPVEVEGFQQTAATHKVSTYQKASKSEVSNSAWIVKHLNERQVVHPGLFEIEAAAGDFYRLLIGERQPKGRVIVRKYEEDANTDPDAIGVMTKLIDKYTPISDHPIDWNNIAHVKQFAEITIASIFLEEADLSDDNLGFNAKNELVKIDHGQSFWSIGKSYKSGRQPMISFAISAEEIRKMPLMSKKYGMPLDLKALEMLSTHPEFINAKFKMLLKIALMTDEVCRSISNAFINEPYLKDQMYHLMIEKRDQLLTTLKSMPEFQSYINDHPQVIHEITQEYTVFNQEFHKEKNAHRKIEITKVELQYSELAAEMKAQLLKPPAQPVSPLQDNQLQRLKTHFENKIQQRLNVLLKDSSTLASIKHQLFTDIQKLVKAASSSEDVVYQFNTWLQKPFISTDSKTSKYDHMTYHQIISLRRNWDPRTTKSAGFIDEIQAYLKANIKLSNRKAKVDENKKIEVHIK